MVQIGDMETLALDGTSRVLRQVRPFLTSAAIPESLRAVCAGAHVVITTVLAKKSQREPRCEKVWFSFLFRSCCRTIPSIQFGALTAARCRLRGLAVSSRSSLFNTQPSRDVGHLCGGRGGDRLVRSRSRMGLKSPANRPPPCWSLFGVSSDPSRGISLSTPWPPCRRKFGRTSPSSTPMRVRFPGKEDGFGRPCRKICVISRSRRSSPDGRGGFAPLPDFKPAPELNFPKHRVYGR